MTLKAVDHEPVAQKPPTITNQPQFHVTHTKFAQGCTPALNMPIQDSQDYVGVFKVLANSSSHYMPVGSVRDMAQVILV